MGISIRDIELAALTPVQKMELADALYDIAQQQMEALTTPLSHEQIGEVQRRIGELDAGTVQGEPWDVARERLMRQS